MERGQAGAIPYRWRKDEPSFCLITTSRGTKWGFPKGIIELGDSAPATALREAHEEAGVVGAIVGEPVGSFRQTKWGTTFRVEVYLMTVETIEATWDEQDVRQRRWCDADEAATLVRGRPVEPVFHQAVRRLLAE